MAGWPRRRQPRRWRSETYDQAIVVTVGDQPALVIYQADVDPLEGESLPAKADAALSQLRLALDETGEFRDPARLARAAALVLAVTAAYVSSLWLVIGIDRRMATRLAGSAERRLRRLPGGEALLRVADARTTVKRCFTIVSAVLAFVLTYSWLAIVLRRIPYTRSWGETLRSSLFSTVASAARSCLDALPDLFKVLVIVTLVRFLARLATMMFVAVEQGRLTLPWVHPDTAPPTRRIVVALLWLCGLVVSVSVPARQPVRGVQGRQRLRGTHRVVRFERRHEPGDERVDAHLLPCAASAATT